MGKKQPDKIQRKPVRRSKSLNYDPCAPFDLMEPPESWQFENPIATGTITGRKKMEAPKLNLAAFVPDKEVKEVASLSEEKLVKMVAEEYNGDATISEIQAKFGINRRRFVELRDKAVGAGLITELRKVGRPRKDKPVEDHAQTERVPEPGVTIEDFGKEVSENTMIVPPRATVEDFAKQAEDKLAQAERLAKEAERLQQAGKIALAIEELLTERAGHVIAALYAEVAV